jgi:hypothetical protein
MSARSALPTGKRWFRVIGFALVAAILIDRIALYAWGYTVVAFYRGILTAWNNPVAAPLGSVRPPWIFVNPGRHGAYTLDLALAGSALSPAQVKLSDTGELTLLFLPPCAAWSTRIFPRSPKGSSASYYGYELTYFTGDQQRPAELHLYRSAYSSRTPVAPGSVWPHFF